MLGRYFVVCIVVVCVMVFILLFMCLCEYIDKIFIFEFVDKVNFNVIYGALLCFFEVINEV